METILRIKSNLLYFVIAMSILFGINGCKTDSTNTTPTTKTDFTDLDISPDFKFSTTKVLEVNLEVITSDPQEVARKFYIYNGNPEQSGQLIVSGMTDPYNRFQTEIKIPTYLNQLYLVSKNAYNETETVVVDATGNSINYSFESVVLKMADFKTVTSSIDDPGCMTIEEINNDNNAYLIEGGNYNNDINIDNNKTYYILSETTVNTGSKKIKFKGGTLIVCGNLITKKIDADNNGGDLIISANGDLDLEDGQIKNKLDTFITFGNVSTEGQTNIQTTFFENNGTFTASSENGQNGINIQTDDFYNNGTMTVNGHFNNNDIGFNNGTLIITGHFNTNGSNREFTNACKMVIGLNFSVNGEFTNLDGAYVSVGQNSTFGGNSDIYMGANSLITTVNNLTINDNVIGPDVSCARFDVGDNLSINGGNNSEISGYVTFCDATPGEGGDTQDPDLGTNGSLDCESCFIPVSTCNPGSGTPPVTDSDNDGCADDIDEYDDDPARCSNTFYPSEDGITSLAFEDLWVAYGDYDFNDLVVETNYKIVKNADNDIVEIFGEFHIAAVGASMNNGFGIEFNVPTSAIASVSGAEIDGSAVTMKSNGIEDGPINKAVMIVYSAISDYLGTTMVNTIPGGNSMEIETITVHILFTEPQTQEDIGLPPYNPFMFISQQRGKEIHLIDHAPTELVDVNYFGEGEDDSDPLVGRYYVSSTNLPWVIEIPAAFSWPNENADILSAYLKFQEWAESEGELYEDWYENDAGYREEDNIYQQQ